jgi:hypothetical protein
VVGIVVGVGTALVSSLVIEPQSVKRDRRLRNLDHLLTEVYGPIQYALRRAQSRARALQKQNVNLEFALYVSEVKMLTETFQKEWGLLSLDVQEAWLQFAGEDAYLYLEQLLQGKFSSPYVMATAKQVQPLLALVEKHISGLRHEYEESSGLTQDC